MVLLRKNCEHASTPAPSISYTGSPFTWLFGVANSTANVTNVGGTVTSYAVQAGALPTGVSLNTSTGAITGTPLSEHTGGTATIRATGPGGTHDAVITFDVGGGWMMNHTEATTVSPSLTLVGGATITPRWIFDDSTVVDGLASGSKALAAGAHWCYLQLYNHPEQVATIDFNADAWVFPVSKAALLTACTSLEWGDNRLTGSIEITWPSGLTYIHVTYCTDLTGNFASVSWPSGATYISFHGADDLTGAIENATLPSTLVTLQLSQSGVSCNLESVTWPTGVTTLRLGNNTSGDINASSLPTGLRIFDAGGSSVGFSADPTWPTTIEVIELAYCGLTQAEVDRAAGGAYTGRNGFSDATPSMNVAGNTAPSGTYQYAATPSTGKEKIYALINDDDAEGFNNWTIYYDA
jgi:hypothetical protein